MKSIQEELEEAKRMLVSYEELATEQMDDDAFVARGNGFCDRKYSDDFIEMQIARLEARVAELTTRAALEEEDKSGGDKD